MAGLVRRLSIAIAALLSAVGAGLAADKPTLVSINVCTDQLLVDLADPEQIFGVTVYSTDPNLSWVSERARPYKSLSAAEAVISAAPDVVLAGAFNKGETRAVLSASGLHVATFELANHIAAVRAQIGLAGRLMGQEARAAERVAALDAAISRLQAVALKKPLRILPLQRRGWVAGNDTLISEILALAGLRNVGGELGLAGGGVVGLERLIGLKPDLILASREETLDEDEGSALLQHPALRAMVPVERWIYIPGKLTVCGSGGLIEALNLLADRITDLRRAGIAGE